MNYRFVSHNSSSRLIIIFAGWAMDYRLFTGLSRAGYDIAVVWDYSSLQADFSFAAGYDEICLVAWSLGVVAAASTTACLADRLTRRIAVNGTQCPVDDLRGIPEAIFMGTLHGLDERNLMKFYRRVAGSGEAYRALSSKLPERDIKELAAELAAFAQRPAEEMQWDMAIVGRRDAIFPPDNQARAWEGTKVCMTDEPHLPDFQRIIDTYIIDKERMSERFAAHSSTYDSCADVQAHIAREMMSMLDRHSAGMTAETVLEIGSGTGVLSRMLHERLAPGSALTMWDIASQTPFEADATVFCQCDAEMQIRNEAPESYGLIASASTIQWFHSPQRFMADALKALKPGGRLLIGTYTEGNLHELTELSGVGLELPSAERWLTYTAGYELLECITESKCLQFDTPREVLQHLKRTGVNSLGKDSANTVAARTLLREMRPDAEGKYPLTYSYILFLAQRPYDK